MSDEPVILIDLSSIVHPLFHLSADQPDPNWTSTQAIARVRALANNHAAVAVCTEGGRSFRKDLSADYKANRPEKNEPLVHQLKRTEDACRADGYPVWRAETYEADDVIATAARLAVEAGRSVVVCSQDKDLMQLVSPDVAFQSLKTDALLTDLDVITKFGVRPGQMGDYLALVGDSADNIKGAPGIGPVKAKDLLAQFQTLDGVLAAARDGKLTNGTAKALLEHSLQIQRARLLVTLKTDAPIDFSEILKPRVPQEAKDTMSDMIAEIETEPKPASDGPQPGAKTDAIAVRPEVVEPFTGAWERQLEPRTAQQTMIISRSLFQSGLLSGYGNPHAVMAIIFAGRELGLGMMASLRGFHSVKGRVTMAADLMRALVLSSGKAEYFLCTERTPEKATWTTKRKGDPQATTVTFTFAEAQAAGLVAPNSGWSKHQASMVAKTGSSILARLAYSDVTFGLYSPGELGGDDE